MSITLDPMSSLVDQSESDVVPGSIDVGWAERAYRDRPTGTSSRRRPRKTAIHRTHHLWRLLAALAVLIVAVGLVVVLSSGASSPTNPRPITSSHHAVRAANLSLDHPRLTPPLLKRASLPLALFATPKQ